VRDEGHLRGMCAELDARARSAIDELIASLGEADRVRLVGSMETIENLLDAVPALSDRPAAPPDPGTSSPMPPPDTAVLRYPPPCGHRAGSWLRSITSV
jgi:hypothetical protein